MPDKHFYEYAIIRFLPYVERGEFFNIGVILYSKLKKFIGIRYFVDENKMNAFNSKFDKEEIEDFLKSWENVCYSTPESGVIGQMEMPDRFRWLVATRSTVIQSSPIHVGKCDCPEKEIEVIFERFVLV